MFSRAVAAGASFLALFVTNQWTLAATPERTPGTKAPSFTEEGIASWYRSRRAMAAAHRTLPIGSKVRVTAGNGRSLIVTIAGRGPFVKGRIIDLTSDAFTHLVSLRKGLVRVRVDLVGRVAHSDSVRMRNEVRIRSRR